MKRAMLSIALLLSSGGVLAAADLPVETFYAYVDSDICARLMLGPIDESRVLCTLNTVKDGATPVLIRLANNMVLQVNQPKVISKVASQFVLATGLVKVDDGTMKLMVFNPAAARDIPAGDPAQRLIDVRQYRTDGSAKIYEKVRHELAMMPYISDFDFISFNMVRSDVILSGWTVRPSNRNEAYNRVKSIPGVESVVNNIDVLPLGRFDMQIRADARALLQRSLRQYFWSNGSDIKIIVKNGDVILLGSVARQADSDMASIKCNQVQGVFHVFNLLRITAQLSARRSGG